MHSASAAEQAWRGALAVRVSLDSTELATLQAPRGEIVSTTYI